MKTYHQRLGAVLVLLAVVTGCNSEAGPSAAETKPAAAATPAYGDTRIEGSIASVSSLIPNITSDSASHEVGDFMYNGLVKVGKDLNPVPDLAKSWTFSKDCLTLDFTLHDKVKWHDGKPFTAEDVVFTWQTTMDDRVPSPYKSDYQDVDKVEARGPNEVRVTYKRPYAKAVVSWGVPMLPRHLLEPWVRDGKIKDAPQNWTAPVGTGPYMFKEFKSGEKVVVVANPNYFMGRPHIARVVYRIIPSQATIFLELKAKSVDYSVLTALQYARQTEYPAFEKAYKKFRFPGGGYTYFGMNLKDPRFADKRVRRAFAHAINKQELLDGVVLGLGREATGPFRPGTWADNPNVKPIPFDPKRALALLAEAGWKEKNGDGLLVKDGVPFTFELLTNQGNDERKKVAEIIQARLREIGVGVEIRILEWAALLKEHIKKRQFQAIILGWGTGTDPDQYVVWHSSQMGPDQLNHISYANPDADALLEAGRSSCVQADRVRHYHRLHQLLADDQPLVFLYWRDALYAASSRIYGIEPAPAGLKWNSPDWFVPKALQRYTPN